MFDPSFMAPVTILSLIFVAVSFLLNHYMADHDGYTGRLSKLQFYCRGYRTYCRGYKTSDEHCCNYMNSIVDKDIIDECNWFRIALIHFGPISLTLMACFLVAIFIATYLMIKLIPYCEPSLRNTNLPVVLIILMVNLILLSQLWFYSRQGNQIARWIEELEKIGFDKCCEKYLEKKSCPLVVESEWG